MTTAKFELLTVANRTAIKNNKARIPTTQEFATTRIALTKKRLDAAHTQNNITFTTLVETKKQPECGNSLRLAPIAQNILKQKYSTALFENLNLLLIPMFYRAL